MTSGVWATLAAVSRAGAALLVFFVLARVWGAEPFGRFIFTFTICSIAVKLLDFGFAVQLNRDVALGRGAVHDVITTALRGKILLTAPFAALCLIGVTIFHVESAPLVTSLLIAEAGLNSFATFFCFPLRGLGKFEVEGKLTIYTNALQVLSICSLVVAFGVGPTVVALVMVLNRTIQLVVAWLAVVRLVPGVRVLEAFRHGAASGLRRGLPFGIHATVSTLCTQLDTIAVQMFLGSAAVGVYQVGARLLSATLLVLDAFNTTYVSKLGHQWRNAVQLRQSARSMATEFGLVGMAGAFLFAVMSSLPFESILGPSFGGLRGLLPAFGVLFAVKCVGTPASTLLTLGHKQKLRALGVCVLALGMVALTWTLTPLWGTSGVLFATILSHLGLYIFYFVVGRRDFGSRVLPLTDLVPFAATALITPVLVGMAPVAVRAAVVIAGSASMGLWLTSGKWRHNNAYVEELECS